MALNLVSQLAHVEIVSPKPEATARFCADVLGLEESGRHGQSVYFRGWGEHFHHSLKVTEGVLPGLGHIAWRSFGEAELEDAVRRIEATGRGEGWTNGDVGHGRAYRYRGPGGHLHEIFWDVERFVPSPAMAPTFPSRPQRYAPRGVAARNIDHVTVASQGVQADVAWYRDTLGHRFMEYTVSEEDPDFTVFAMTTVCERAHDMGFVIDPSGAPGRLHHVAFWVDHPDELRRAADVLLDADVPLEFGPGRHGHGEQDYLYFREPGGVRIEINTGGYRNHQPDWTPVRWVPSQGSNVFYRNMTAPHSMMESFPPVETAEHARIDRSALFA